MPPRPKSGDTSKSGRKPIRSIQTGTDILRNVRSSRNSESIAMKPGLNRREHRLRSRGALQRLEPDEGKLSRPVLRGGGGSNAVSLPDNLRRSLQVRERAAAAVQTSKRLTPH